MNLMFTRKCNLDCSYCFAKQKMHFGDMPAELSKGNLRKFIRFLKRSGEKEVNIIGGEPTLHSSFVELMDQVFKSGMEAVLFTNGIIPPDRLKYLASLPPENYKILINANDPRTLSSKHARALENTLEVFAGQGNVALGINIFSEDQDFDYIIRYARKHSYPLLRWSIANPTCGSGEHNYRTRYRKIVKRAVQFLERANGAGLHTHADDVAIVPCLISSKYFTTLHLFDDADRKLTWGCTTPPIDVDTSLRLMRCFAMPYYDGNYLDDFESFEEVNRYFKYLYGQLFNHHLFSKCRTCRYKRSRGCYEGCLAAKCNYLDIDPHEIIIDAVNSPTKELLKTKFRLKKDFLSIKCWKEGGCRIMSRHAIIPCPPSFRAIVNEFSKSPGYRHASEVARKHGKRVTADFIRNLHYWGLLELKRTD